MEIAKAMNGAAGKLKDAETQLRIADLITALADARTKLVDVEEQSIKQEQEIKRLQEQLAFIKALRFERPYYMHYAEDGSKDGPYCPTCYDSGRKSIRLQLRQPGEWVCRAVSSSSRILTMSRLNRHRHVAVRIGDS